MDKGKAGFIKNEFIPLLRTLPSKAKGKWGKMNGQQMVEHVAGFFKVSTNKLHFTLATPIEHLPKFKAFLLSDKEFRENTKAPVLPEEPVPMRFANMEEAVTDLDNEVKYFFDNFENEKGLITQHPVFGYLNYDEWILLHYKHVVHHLKQFGLL